MNSGNQNNSSDSSPTTTASTTTNNKDSTTSNNTFQSSNNADQYYLPMSTDDSANIINYEQKIRPVIINHNKEAAAAAAAANEKLSSVVKVVKNANNGKSSPQQLNGADYESTKNNPSPRNAPKNSRQNPTPQQPFFSDDLNNNQLKLNNNQLSTNANNAQIVARIHSNGAQYPAGHTGGGAPVLAHAYNLNPIMSSSTNYSMTASMVSNGSAMARPSGALMASSTLSTTNNNTTANTTVNNLLNNPNLNSEPTFNGSNNTLLSASSIAIIDVNNSNNGSRSLNANTDTMTTTSQLIDQSSQLIDQQHTSLDTIDHSDVRTKPYPKKDEQQQQNFYSVNTSQPRAMNNHAMNASNKTNDSVRYKFKSNETIGTKGDEFDDINVKTNATKRDKCGPCLKCCNVM